MHLKQKFLSLEGTMGEIDMFLLIKEVEVDRGKLTLCIIKQYSTYCQEAVVLVP